MRKPGPWLAVIIPVVLMLVSVLLYQQAMDDPRFTTAPEDKTNYLPSVATADDKYVAVPKDPRGHLLPQDAPQLKPGDPKWLTAPAEGFEWQRTDHYPDGAGAFSHSDGPTTFINDIAAGYAHTPRGAAMASTTILAAYSGDRESCLRVNQEFFIPPRPEQDCEDTQKLRDSYAGLLRKAGFDEDAFVIPMALEPLSYDRAAPDTRAVIRLWYFRVRPNKQGTFLSRDVPVIWVDGQWKIDVRSGEKIEFIDQPTLPIDLEYWEGFKYK